MKKIFLSIITSLVVLSSCNDDRINEEAEFQPMDEFYNENKPEEQEFVITSDTGSAPIVGMEGTELWGFRNILEHRNGDEVQLPYSLKLIELYSYEDMILYRMPTLASTSILESGGEVKITAWESGKELVLKSGEKYPLVLATTPTKAGMSVYHGDHPNNEFGSWDASSDGSIIIQAEKYQMHTAKMGWQNCGQAGSNDGTTDIKFSVEGKGGEFIDLYIALKDYKGLLKGNNLVVNHAPIGQKATIVAMAKDQNDEYRLHKQEIMITDGLEITLDMQVLSETALLSTLAGL